MALTVNRREVEGISVLSCDGRIDFGEDAGVLRTAIKALIPGTSRVIIDLEHATHMDSGGLGVMVSLYCSAQAAGTEIKLANLGPRLRGLLQITKLVTVFEVYDTVEQAVASFHNGKEIPARGTG